MNSIEFLHMLSNKKGEYITDSIVDNFDHCMTLYNMINGYPYHNINYTRLSPQSVQFDIDMDNESISLLQNQIIQNQCTILAYNRRYAINTNIGDEFMNIELTQLALAQ